MVNDESKTRFKVAQEPGRRVGQQVGQRVGQQAGGQDGDRDAGRDGGQDRGSGRPYDTVAARTRTRIIDRAEELFAGHGIAGVSMRQIARAAGQKNVAAVQYHFGTKEELIRAIFAARMGPFDERRIEYLRRLKHEGGDNDLRAIVAAMARPMVERLELGEEGYDFLLFSFQVRAYSTRLQLESSVASSGEGFRMGVEMIRNLLREFPAPVLAQRLVHWADLLLYAFADRTRKLRLGEANSKDNTEFARNLIDSLVGILNAPIGPELE